MDQDLLKVPKVHGDPLKGDLWQIKMAPDHWVLVKVVNVNKDNILVSIVDRGPDPEELKE